MSRNLWPLQSEAGEGAGGAGENPAQGRKAFVEEEVKKRYQPREVREYLARYGDNAEVALENVVKQANEMTERLMRRQAELEYDLRSAQQQIETAKQESAKVVEERDQALKQIEEHAAKERQAKVNDLLDKRFADPVMVTRHKAYLHLEGYELDADGDNLMLVKDGKRHRFDTVVNDDFFTKYPDAKPKGDDPLILGGAGGKDDEPLHSQAAKYYAESDKRASEGLAALKGL